MTNHKLKKGIGIIDSLITLGRLLGYHTETEFPVNDAKKRAPAVDVAWFKDNGQRFPLFIFEVESASTNSMTYNPTKVYAKSNEKFEKPLFYFQLIVKGGGDSARVEDLRELFGAHNYRIYRLSTDERFALILDVLTQHRRLTQEIDFVRICNFLYDINWIEMDWPKFMEHSHALGFENESGKTALYLTILASSNSHFIRFLVDYLKTLYSAKDLSTEVPINYDTYFGAWWSIPLNLGIIYSTAECDKLKIKCFEQLRYFQESYTNMKMIGPYYDLNYEYGKFLIWTSGGLLSLISLLFSDHKSARTYLTNILYELIEPLPYELRVVNFTWLMHLTPDTAQGRSLYEKAKFFFEETVQCFSLGFFLNPTLEIHNDDSEFWEDFFKSQDKVPTFDDSRRIIKAHFASHSRINDEKVILTCRYLTSEFIENGGENIVRLLHT